VYFSSHSFSLISAGLALLLFGGSNKRAITLENGTRAIVPKVGIRGDIHVLLVGDPGLGKSQLLQAITQLAPRGVYVCGSYSSSSGLTVSLIKESNSQQTGRDRGGQSDYVLEAGALVLADQGLCCIDEFDKMSRVEHQSLLEAMEQQTISVCKAGVVCTLPARTSLLCAANPRHGHYTQGKTLLENVHLPLALLSRFDLIFILRDLPDETRDRVLAEHVMGLHDGVVKTKLVNVKPDPQRDVSMGTVDVDDDNDDAEDSRPLLVKLRDISTDEPPLPQKLLRKYIGYAKKYVSPTLTEGACQVIQKFYLSLRERQQTQDTSPVTTRQLESLIRLAEARAKLELRELVTQRDAEDVVEIMKQSLADAFEDDLTPIDFRQFKGMSKQKMITTFVTELTKRAQNSDNVMFTTQQLYNIAKEMHLQVPNFDDFVETLNHHNYLLKKGPQLYKLQIF
jgi:DNA helicase MCM8